MRTTPANDLRVTKALEAIDTAFRTLTLEKGLTAITVKEVAWYSSKVIMVGPSPSCHRWWLSCVNTALVTDEPAEPCAFVKSLCTGRNR